MVSAELRQALEEVRAVLSQDPEWSVMNAADPPGGRLVDGPADYVDLLRVTDGLICGQLSVLSAKFVTRAQFHVDPLDGAPIQLGRDKWFCFGKVGEDPLLLNREDASVWGFPDAGIVWWKSDRFERFADNLDRFLLDYAFGAGYLTMAGVQADDQWWRLLRHLGRVI
jgi:hypothetical protein